MAFYYSRRLFSSTRTRPPISVEHVVVFSGGSRSPSPRTFQSRFSRQSAWQKSHPSVLAGHKTISVGLLFPDVSGVPRRHSPARAPPWTHVKRKITNTHTMSCVSATSAVARVAPTARVANKRAANVAPMRAARVNVVAAVDLNGASLLRSARREPVALAARASVRRITRSTRARGACARRSARAPAPRSREESWKKRSRRSASHVELWKKKRLFGIRAFFRAARRRAPPRPVPHRFLVPPLTNTPPDRETRLFSSSCHKNATHQP